MLEGGTDDLERFNELVNAQVKKGFQPLGPAFGVVTSGFGSGRLELFQTMVKYYSVGGDG